jgi:hypothetical protein
MKTKMGKEEEEEEVEMGVIEADGGIHTKIFQPMKVSMICTNIQIRVI